MAMYMFGYSFSLLIISYWLKSRVALRSLSPSLSLTCGFARGPPCVWKQAPRMEISEKPRVILHLGPAWNENPSSSTPLSSTQLTPPLDKKRAPPENRELSPSFMQPSEHTEDLVLIPHNSKPCRWNALCRNNGEPPKRHSTVEPLKDSAEALASGPQWGLHPVCCMESSKNTYVSALDQGFPTFSTPRPTFSYL